jgi:hypothetical protein
MNILSQPKKDQAMVSNEADRQAVNVRTLIGLDRQDPIRQNDRFVEPHSMVQ